MGGGFTARSDNKIKGDARCCRLQYNTHLTSGWGPLTRLSSSPCCNRRQMDCRQICGRIGEIELAGHAFWLNALSSGVPAHA